jgi:hypothetical protein
MSLYNHGSTRAKACITTDLMLANCVNVPLFVLYSTLVLVPNDITAHAVKGRETQYTAVSVWYKRCPAQQR